jgi:hypothetical protein
MIELSDQELLFAAAGLAQTLWVCDSADVRYAAQT